MLAIIEIFGNVSAFGDRADDFKKILNENAVLEFSLHFLKQLKDMTDIMIEHKIYEPEEKFAAYSSRTRMKHPFGGFLSKIVKLVANLTYTQQALAEQVFRKNKDFLGLILSFTKLDEDNPTLREWSLLTVRNLCAASEKIRSELDKMKLVDLDIEGKKALERMGMKEIFDKEMKKLQKRDENKRHIDKI